MNTELERARRIAVALEQEQARLRDLAADLAQRWTDMAARATDRYDAAPTEDARRAMEWAHAYTVAARDLRWILAHNSIPHDLMTAAEEEAS